MISTEAHHRAGERQPRPPHLDVLHAFEQQDYRRLLALRDTLQFTVTNTENASYILIGPAYVTPQSHALFTIARLNDPDRPAGHMTRQSASIETFSHCPDKTKKLEDIHEPRDIPADGVQMRIVQAPKTGGAFTVQATVIEKGTPDIRSSPLRLEIPSKPQERKRPGWSKQTEHIFPSADFPTLLSREGMRELLRHPEQSAPIGCVEYTDWLEKFRIVAHVDHRTGLLTLGAIGRTLNGLALSVHPDSRQSHEEYYLGALEGFAYDQKTITPNADGFFMLEAEPVLRGLSSPPIPFEFTCEDQRHAEELRSYLNTWIPALQRRNGSAVLQ